MTRMIVLVSFFATLASLTPPAKADVIGSVYYAGRRWNVDVVTYGPTAQVWLRYDPYACTNYDIGFTLSITTGDINQVKGNICRLRGYYEDAKFVLGCGATVGSVVCATAGPASIAATAGVSTPVVAAACSVTMSYAVKAGVADCIEGIAERIAQHLGAQREWRDAVMITKLSEGDLKALIRRAIDYACEDVKGPKK